MKHALVVDDDRGMVRTLMDVLGLRGWSVDAAHSGEEALAAVGERPYGVVLMDVRMPGIDGVTALKAMRSRRPDQRIILMTAYAAHDLLAEAERAGVLRVLPKPLDLPLLFGMLDPAA